jgi:hypothetical protein
MLAVLPFDVQYVTGGGGVPSACETVKGIPATVNVALRAAPVLAATVYPIVPLPVPDAPEVMVIQPGTPLTGRRQLPAIVTVTLPDPDPPPNEALAGEIDTEHSAGL